MNFLIRNLIKVLKLEGLCSKVVNYICGVEVLPKPLSEADEESLVIRLNNNDMTAKDKLIEHNLRLVVYLAKKFDNTGIELDDLVSVGTLGLIKAINSFELSKKIKLATYASRCIENEILMYLRKVVRRRGEISLDEPLNTDSDGNELLLSDILGTDSDIVYKDIETTVEKQLLTECLCKLNKREKEIISMRYGLGGFEEQTQKDVADLLGISQSYISRLEKKIIGRLKKEITKLI